MQAAEETAAGLARRVAMNRALFEAALRVCTGFAPASLHQLYTSLAPALRAAALRVCTGFTPAFTPASHRLHTGFTP